MNFIQLPFSGEGVIKNDSISIFSKRITNTLNKFEILGIGWSLNHHVIRGRVWFTSYEVFFVVQGAMLLQTFRYSSLMASSVEELIRDLG